MRLNFDDSARGLLIAFLHGIFPLLNLLKVVHLDGEQVAAIQIFISSGITLVFAIFKTGQQADPAAPPVATVRVQQERPDDPQPPSYESLRR